MTITADGYVDEVLRQMPRATPQRAQIALELRGHIAERLATGQSLDDVVRQLGTPATLAESYLSAVPLVSPPLVRRLLAKLVDLTAAFLLPGLVGAALWFMYREAAFPIAVLLVVLGGTVLFAVGTIASEYVAGQTPGKWLFGLRVVRANGARISLGQAMVRTLPFFLQGVFHVDAAFVFFTEKQQRAFELLSKTRVVAATLADAA